MILCKYVSMTGEPSAERRIELKDLDLRLIKLLESDPRSTQSGLAAKLGISRPTVGSVMQKLTESHVIRTVCLADHIALGYTDSVVFGINTMPGRLRGVSDELASFAPIHYVAICAGPFDVMAWGLFKGREEILDFITGGLGRVKGLSRFETIMCQEVKISPAYLSDSEGYRPAEKPVSLDQLDMALIGSLQRDSRQTAADLAASLGTSKPTVLRRMKRLHDEGVIRLMTMVDPAALGYKVVISTGLKVTPDRIKEVAEGVGSHRNVHSVALCTGRYDVLAWMTFRDRREMMDVLSGELGKIRGIRSMETVTSLKILKASFIYVNWKGELWKGFKKE
ncbi:MAG: Lrp/AsnC family transcriptional regulator [Dehalococcoidia bacterium]|nr:Lrp/AsnC family transcriptional regulator [Dehalococcoidia bacterium]